jgi:hypothetical protein
MTLVASRIAEARLVAKIVVDLIGSGDVKAAKHCCCSVVLEAGSAYPVELSLL